MRKPKKRKSLYSFRHISDTLYELSDHSIFACVRVKSLGQLVIDSKRTAAVTKSASLFEEFLFIANEQTEGSWYMKLTTGQLHMVNGDLHQFLDSVIEHYKNQLARMIVE